ncbi:alpha-L-glutamate ligase [Malaciobacter molluscorum LMG 25693]|uniref:Alpha-L-glutamate ligase n=1 Tax=Malaciobacter molluscorum LMG 25693 TaxID=870501 RepID=A0A2G1DI95_9BACT|nr:helix-hairpin-helix domain-containing protein [Malaciobacter molluscorum]AXX92358.1 glutathione synthase / RimK-type ligase, ATP-grasp superfamily [Malaciobacter molluscorum LMG 25693]PHO18191.1 alpha-L-glutamate ligase [Malaciobacter molluscorum LMG 25693]
MKKLPKLGFLYLDYVLRFFDNSNFKGWPDKIEKVVYHWKNDKKRFINEIKKKKIDILIGNIPATAYDTFVEISKELPNVRFVPSIHAQFPNKSKENVTIFCKKNKLSIPKTKIFEDKEKGLKYLKEKASYPQIIKRSYGPSNYGGYYVHKVDNYAEAVDLINKKKYSPIYTQNAIKLKNNGDIRVMLIGHKPVCAFWRYAGKNQWITNTSQGGHMSYNNIPMNALELAVKSSKAARAEYFACDIAICEKTGKAYILECATAFAAFPYIRDWIGQYLMWDFTKGKFKLPHIPLFSWEELGKINSNLLRTMRHIGFSKYKPSYDGEFIINDDPSFSMEKICEDFYKNFPNNIIETRLELSKQTNNNKDLVDKQLKKMNLNKASLTELMTLHAMQEELAIEIHQYVQENIITDSTDLLELEEIDEQMLKCWDNNLCDMRIDINNINNDILLKIKGIGKKLAKIILEYKKDVGAFKSIDELENIEGIGKRKLEELKSRFKIGE